MTNYSNALLELVQIGVSATCLFSESLYQADWKELIKLASKHGVASVCLKGLEVMRKHGFDICPTEEKLQLYARQQIAEKHSRKQLTVSTAFANSLKPLKVVVLKGIDYAHYWDKAEWREFGDLDCWMIGDGMTHQESFSKSNELAATIGARVEEYSYKHNRIHYNGLTIENHLTLTSFEGREDGKALELFLQHLLGTAELKQIGETNLYSPSAGFTAIFMLVHAQRHFLTEGVQLRHVLDWYFFLEREGKTMDWAALHDKYVRFKLDRFVDILTHFCEVHLGLPVGLYPINVRDDELLERFTEDLFAEKRRVSDRSMVNIFCRLYNRFRRMWIFRDLNSVSYWRAVWLTLTYSSVWKRQPSLG